MESPPRPNATTLVDIHMASPPRPPAQSATPVFDLAGASRTSGGIIRGRALGNVFNYGDAEDITQSMMGPRVGRVQIFTERADPTSTKPLMVLKHEITPKLGPILKTLARKYSPIRSKSSILLLSL